jgi:Family of unknown function (DUF6076)
MPEGTFTRTLGVERRFLQAARDCLLWAYAEYEQPARCQLEFWAWALGPYTHQLMNPNTPHATGVLEKSADWPWLALQRQARRFLEKLFAGVGNKRPPTVAVMPRALRPARGDRGDIVLRWQPLLSGLKKPWDWILLFLDELLTDLDGVSKGVVSRCASCGHYFIRATARRKDYCSDACRGRALYQRRKFRQAGTRARSRHAARR